MNTAKSIISIAILIAFSVMPRILKADSQKLLDSKVLFGFQGKGSSLVYDTAVLQVSYDRIPAVKQQQLVFSANSSGAILAVYFSCHGVNPTTINSVRNWMTGGSGRVQKAVKDFMATGENIIHKFGQLKLGIIPEVPIDNLDPFIEKAVGINHISELNSAKCVPQIPFVIAAANYEVIDNRHPKFSVPFNAIDIRTFKPSEDPRIKFPSLQEKDFNYKNFDVSWKPQTHKKFLEMGETPEGLKKFEAGHRGLKLSESPVIGKACTYFATPELFEL